MGTQPPSPKTGWSPQIFGPCLLCPNSWMHHDATRYGGRPQPRGLCVRWVPSPLPEKGAEPPPQFSVHVYCGQTAGWIKVALGMEVGLGPCHIVLDGDPAPFPKKGQSPQFLSHVYCDPTAAWIKMPLGTELGLGPGDIVLDGDPAPLPQNRSPKRGQPPFNFRPILLWPNG